jgi:TMEM199 family protein
MESLRREQEEKAYAAMVGTDEKEDSIQSITREVSDQISVILNVLFSSIFTGLAIWYATANLTNWKRREALRAGLSILVAFVVAIAEIVLYNSYRRKMAEAKAKERATTEVKTLICDPK